MIKNITGVRVLSFSSVQFFLLSAGESFLCWFFFIDDQFLGFSIGLAAFGVAFSGLEMILRRVFALDGLKEGVSDSLFWLALKFFGPMGLLHYGLMRGFPVVAIFLGLLFGLCNVAAILFTLQQTSAKNR